MIIATSSQMKNNFGKYLQLAIENGEVLIERNGVIVAKLIADQRINNYLINNLKGIGVNKDDKSLD